MQDFYTLNVAGLTRQLPICPINENLYIAGFVMFSDVELTIRCAQELIKKIPECDVIVTAESKGIPLAYEMAKQLGIKYIVARKKVKAYMTNPISVNVHSITTAGTQTLILDREEADFLTDKRVVIVDDVISTGESLTAIESLLKEAKANVIAKSAVLAEGDASERDDIIYLEKLPLFFK